MLQVLPPLDCRDEIHCVPTPNVHSVNKVRRRTLWHSSVGEERYAVVPMALKGLGRNWIPSDINGNCIFYVLRLPRDIRQYLEVTRTPRVSHPHSHEKKSILLVKRRMLIKPLRHGKSQNQTDQVWIFFSQPH